MEEKSRKNSGAYYEWHDKLGRWRRSEGASVGKAKRTVLEVQAMVIKGRCTFMLMLSMCPVIRAGSGIFTIVCICGTKLGVAEVSGPPCRRNRMGN
jgi:hypothetical protein